MNAPKLAAAAPALALTLVPALVLAACGSDANDGLDAAVYAAPYSQTIFDDVRIRSNAGDDAGLATLRHALSAVEFHDGPFAAVTLIVDLRSTCYPFSNWSHDPPPPGQNWPADCDAFDRNFEIALDAPEPGDATAPPGLELMRAITPFGGPLHLELDVTDVANGLPGRHAVLCTIPTYSDGAGKVSGSDGGWNVSAHIEATPGAAPRRVLAVTPLYYGDQHVGDTPPVAQLATPAGTTSVRVEYRATGHGGANDPSIDCSGPAEEFCVRTHHVFVDDAELEAFMPWRDDCDQLCTIMHQGAAAPGGFDYCLENPCGAIASVRAPRANWCPGSLTPPRTWDPPALRAAGAHTFRYAIDGEAPGGVWRQSATFFAFGD
jgi:Peptide-N-glycosidase F, C terminal